MSSARVRLALLFTGLLCLAVHQEAFGQDRSEITIPPNGDNQKAEVSQWIGLVQVTIRYHSPRVHLQGMTDRTGHIWGELVWYGLFDEGLGPTKAAPWRAGANENTTVTFSHDVKVEGKDLKAGTYALFLEAAKDGPWTWIFSSHATGWGSYQYDPANDALRVPVTTLEAPFTEYLTYGFDDRVPASATAYLQWENKRIPFRIDVPNVNDLYIAQIREDLLSWPGFSYQNWQRAALFAVANKINLDEALVWADKAIYQPFRNASTGRADYSTLSTKAAVLRAMGRQADADTTMDRAIRFEDATVGAIHRYGMSLLQRNDKTRALAVFAFNRERHPEEKFVTFLGLARGYTATGERKKAIANWEIVLKNVPAGLESSRPEFEATLTALREGREPAAPQAAASPVQAQAAPAPPKACADDPLFAKLDFWVGSWDVYAGTTLDGHDRVTRILNGCAVTEEWSDADGGKGLSLFYVPPGTDQWRQVWVTDRATTTGGEKEKRLVEQLPDGGIRFQGSIPKRLGGQYLDRTTLTPLANGEVHQVIEISTDGGATWRIQFDARYRKSATPG